MVTIQIKLVYRQKGVARMAESGLWHKVEMSQTRTYIWIHYIEG